MRKRKFDRSSEFSSKLGSRESGEDHDPLEEALWDAPRAIGRQIEECSGKARLRRPELH
ncbi:MAG: hypothetical protein LC781_08805 [Actinobacteria bacterium]|nr:hypothetical protein [Actinomycetota bacterium]